MIPMPFVDGLNCSSSSSSEDEDPLRGYRPLVEDELHSQGLGPSELGAQPLEGDNVYGSSDSRNSQGAEEPESAIHEEDARVCDEGQYCGAHLNKLLPRGAHPRPASPPLVAAAAVGGGEDFHLDVDLVKRVASSIRLKSPPPSWVNSLGAPKK
jgi:hypothetical protein